MRSPFVHEWFASNAAAGGDLIAIDSSTRTLTYAELDRRSNSLAHALTSLVPRGTLIGILTDDIVTVVTGMIATLKAGCAFVPMDPSSGDARLATLIDAVDLTWWIADSSTLHRLSTIGEQRERGFRALGAFDATPAGHPGVEVTSIDLAADSRPCLVARDPDDLCYIYFTSGSTGQPKGIAGRLKAIDHFVRWEARTVGAREGFRFSQLTNPVFDAFLRDVFTPLCTGGVVCVPADRETKLNPLRLLAWLGESRVNVMHCVPSVLRTLLQIPVEECQLPELAHVLTSGEPLLPIDVQRWLPRFGGHARLTNLYGPSETTMVKFAYPVRAADAERRFVSIGKPIEGTRAIVVNEHGKVCPPGVTGEIYIRTPYRSLGYYGRPDLTDEVFIPNPYGSDRADLVYRTGDLGRILEDGNYEFLGRRDHQVKIRGVRVELAEIENALRRDRGVRDVAVIDRDLADGSKSLCAFVVLQDGLTTEALRAAASDLLPEYMMPSMFVPRETLPRTATGKTDRRALEALVPLDRRPPAEIVGPRTPIEELVADAWARAFGVERVGIHDGFFQQLGGHSLLATQVLARLQPLFEIPLKLRWLFQAPTVAGFSAYLENALRHGGEESAPEPPLERIGRDRASAVSFGQERLWVVDKVTGTRAYHMPLAIKLTGEVAPAALAAAVTALSARHEVLRTTFGIVDGRPVQQVEPPARVDVPAVDLSTLTGARQKRAQRAAQAALEAAPFDLGAGPLWRVAVLRLDAATHVFTCTLHHIIADGWSVGVLLRDLAALYEAARIGQDAELPPLTVQYADYAAWQRRVLDSARVAREVEYWRDELAGVTPLALPTDRPRPAVPSGRGGVAWRTWRPELSAQVPAWARAQGATPFMVLLAAWQAVLARYAGQSDIAVGVPIAQRPRPELEPLIGFFLNTLVLRTRFDRAMTWRALVAEVRARSLAAFAHQTVPFEQVIDELQPERDLARTPLFQVLFVLHDLPAFSAQLPELRLDFIESEGTGAKFDLELGIRTGADGLTCRLEYATDLFDRATADRLLAHLEQFVAAAMADADRPVAELPLLTASERDQIVTWNDTAKAWPDVESTSLVAWLEAQAARTPNAIAVWAEPEPGAPGPEPQALTYAGLHGRANQIARRLQRLGVGPESRVGVCLPRSPEMVAAIVGVLKAGGAYVPLDPSYPAARLAFQVADAQVAVVLTSTACAEAVPAGSYVVEVLDTPDAAWREEVTTPSDVKISPDQLAYVIYTSGSTGQPKGAMNTHRGIANRLAWMQATYRLTAADRVLQKTSSSFDVSVWELFWPLGTGATLVVARPGGQNDPEYLADVIRRAGVTVLHFVPAMLEAFVTADGLSACERVRLIVCSGEALPGPLAARCLAAWRGQLENLYGPTEAAVDVTWQPCTPEETQAAVVPIGRPIANTQVYVRDAAGQPAPIGVVGELYLGGVQVGRGYWGRPDLTAERFVPDPFGAPGARLYRTGDLARYRLEGVIEYVGRADHQVKLHGNRIELGEIEAALRRQPQIRDAAVLLRADEREIPRLVAYVVPAPSTDAAASKDAAYENAAYDPGFAIDALQQQLRAQLPDYMVPAVFVVLETLPLSPNGKVDRRALPAPSGERPTLTHTYLAPRSDVETTLARIWTEVLRLDRVGIHDNFFALGGDSILALQVLARAQESGIQLTPRQLFQHQTIADLALVANASEQPSRDWAALEPEDLTSGDVPLTPIQQWFFEVQAATPHHLNQSVLLAGGPVLPPAGWEAIVDAVLTHHDALRLRFAPQDGSWRQYYLARESQRVFMEVDLSAAGPRWRSALESATARLQRSLNLTNGPLIRIVFFRGATRTADRIFIVVHHAVIDGVSWRILLEDLYRASAQWKGGLPINLPEKTSSFRRWADQLHTSRSTLDEETKAYWQAVDTHRKSASLPRDTVGVNSIGSQRHVTIALTEEETQAFLQQPPRAYRMQAHEVLVAAVATTLAGWMGRSEAVLALEGHGRESESDDLNLSRTVGCFTTMFPVCVSVPPGGGPGAILRAVKDQLRGVPRRGLDYGLWRYGVAESPAATPEVMVNYLGQFDQVLDEAGSVLATESMGRARHPAAPRAFVLEIKAGVTGNRLSITIGYSANLHWPETVDTFAYALGTRLRALVAHCRQVPWTRTTPSDVTLTKVTQAELDALADLGGEIESVYPLSPMQEGLLFHALFDPQSSVYFQQFRVRLEGELEIDAFRQAWADVVARHSILRTGFVWEGRERPVQVAYARVPLAFDLQDFRELSPDAQAAHLAEYVEADRSRGFRLDRVPLMRLALVRLGDRAWEVIWSYHHILIDGWCVPLVFKEAVTLYEAHRMRVPAVLPPLGRFSDYIGWLQAQDAAKAEAYWRRTLEGFRSPTPFLPSRETSRTVADQESYARRERHLSARTVDAVQALARQHHVTVNTIVQGAWAILLARYSRTRHVVFGATSSGRPTSLPGIESMIGLFINTLPVRVDVDLNARVVPWLRAIQEGQAEARQYEYTPLVDIQGWSEVPGGLSLFESLLAFENYPVNDELVRGRASFKIASSRVFEKTNYPVTVQVSPAAGLSIRILFDGRRVDATTIERMLGHFEMVLSGLASMGNTRLADLPFLSEAERAQVLTAWNASADEAAALAAATPASLLDQLERQAAATPDAVAVVCEGRALTCATLHRRANQLAHVLRAEGVGPEVPVAVCVNRSIELIVALLGVWKAGGAYVPLDPQTPAARLAYMVRDIGAPVVVTTTALAEQVPTVELTRICLDSDAARLDAAPTTAPACRVTSATLAYVIYTSGSTGHPKGVGITHGNVASLF
ncbi:MAG TPA: amino acid adenylation domain-containing protein, partial [Vicinamibacterales bacterium]|nr:amino acid adenylation domain-containing protein [Vicinamibacterales bacterium]